MLILARPRILDRICERSWYIGGVQAPEVGSSFINQAYAVCAHVIIVGFQRRHVLLL